MLCVPGSIECGLWERFRKQLSQNTYLELGVAENPACTNSSLRIHKIVLLQDDKVSEHSELEIEGENKNRTDWVEESSYSSPSGCGTWQIMARDLTVYLCDPQGITHFEDKRAVWWR